MHPMERKIGKVFWEFLTLFLVVFCGFLAEYQLEHKIERDRANELAKSFYHELKNDSITAGIKVVNRLKQEDELQYMINFFAIVVLPVCQKNLRSILNTA